MKISQLSRFLWTFVVVLSAVLLWAAWRRYLPLSPVEVFAFTTGLITVWLVVKENIWNWPIGIINSAFFAVLFWQSRLFADMGLQIVYIVSGVLGWYWWLHGGEQRMALRISRTSWLQWMILGTTGVVLTGLATWYLRRVNDAAPFLDGLTTVLSLIAQFLLTKKKIENWYIWMAADVIYVGLYFWKDLYLTAGLYVVFFALCVAGLRSWKKVVARDAAALLGGSHV